MTVDLAEPPAPPSLPAGVELRPFRIGTDDRAVHALVQAAFSEIEGNIHHDWEQWRVRSIESSSFDLRWWFIAWAGDEIAGVALSEHWAEDDTGWVGQLAVAPSWRGRGLGRGLLLTALSALFRGRGSRVLPLVSMETTSGPHASTNRSACGRRGGTIATSRRHLPIDNRPRRSETRSKVGSSFRRWGVVAATVFALALGAGGAASAAPIPNAWVKAGAGPEAVDGEIMAVAVGRAGHAYMAVADQLATSANGGQAWTTTSVPAHSVAAGAAGRVYALGRGAGAAYHEPLYVSDDDGATWTTRTTPLVSGKQAGDSQVLADPAVPGLIYVIEGGGAFDCIVAASADSGATWKTPVVDPRGCALTVGPGAGNASLIMGHVPDDDGERRHLVVDGRRAAPGHQWQAGRLADGALFHRQGLGLYRSVDHGDSWESLGTAPGMIDGVDAADPSSLFFRVAGGMVSGPVAGPFTNVCACGGPSTVAGGAGLAASATVLFRRAIAGGAFTAVPGAAVHSTFSDAVGGAGSRFYSLGAGTALHVSTDGGNSWARHPLPVGLPPVGIAPVPGQVGSVYVARERGILHTTDSGATWTPVTGSLPLTGRQVYQVAASGSRVYVVLVALFGSGSWVYATSDAGAHWTLVHRSDRFQAVAVDPAHSSTVFVATASGLIRSADGGASFSVPRPGPGAPVFDAVRPGWLYALGGGRSWRSTDGGLTWRSFAKFHGLTLNSLIPDPKYGGVVYAAARLGGKAVVGRSTDAAASFSSMPGEVALSAPAVVADRLIADGPSFLTGFETTPSVYGWTIDDVTAPGFSLPPYPRLVEGTTVGASVVVKEAWNGYDLDTGVASYQVQRIAGVGAPVPVALDTPLTKERLFTVAIGADTTIQVADKDGAGNAALFRGPRFAVQKVEDGSDVLPLGSHWLRAENRDATAGHLRYATTPGSAFSLTFAGRAIAWVAPRSPLRGQAAVYVDGVKVKTVSLGGAASLLPRRVVFAKAWSTRGTHTLKVVVLPRPAGQSTRVDVDALLLIP